MSVNNPRPCQCIIPGCTSNQGGNGYHLCQHHFETLVLLNHTGEVCDPPHDEATREDVLNRVATFDVDCARAFDAEVLDVNGHVLYMAPVRLHTDYDGRGRIR
jgi:hypothetical protein